MWGSLASRKVGIRIQAIYVFKETLSEEGDPFWWKRPLSTLQERKTLFPGLWPREYTVGHVGTFSIGSPHVSLGVRLGAKAGMGVWQ